MSEVVFKEPVSGSLGFSGSFDNSLFYGYGPPTNLTLGTGWTGIPFSTVRRTDATFFHSLGTSTIEFTENCNITITYSISTAVSSGNSRSQSLSRLVLDVGSGFLPIEDSFAAMYNRNTSEGADSAAVIIYGPVLSGWRIRLQASRLSGTNTIYVPTNTANLHIRKELS